MTELPPPLPADDARIQAALTAPLRLAAVRETGLLDSIAEESFDRLTRLASTITGAPVTFISLLDAHRAGGGPTLFAIGAAQDNPACAVEQAVNAALEEALREAEALLIARLGAVSLAELARSFDARCVAGGWPHPGEDN